MKSTALLLSLAAIVSPLQAAKWPAIPKEVWAMKEDPALVAQGAVILERVLDFQPAWVDLTLRIRILSPAGLAAAEIRDLPANPLSVEGQVTFPDGKVIALPKRAGFQMRKVVSAQDGKTLEEVPVAPGVTSDCVLELTWREQTDIGRIEHLRKPTAGHGYLPLDWGPFWFGSLGSAYPTQSVTVQRSKDVFWAINFNSTGDYERLDGSTAKGTTYTYKNIPGNPPAPFAVLPLRPVPKVIVFRYIPTVNYLLNEVPPLQYWDKVAELFYKDWYLQKLSKGEAYKAWSATLREGVKGNHREKAKLIAERLNRRMVNLDQLRFGEQPDKLARYGVDEGKIAMGNARFYDPTDVSTVNGGGSTTALPVGAEVSSKYTMDDNRVSAFNYMAKTGYVDNKGITRLLFHLLADEGIHAQVALVSDRRKWMVNPDIRTPFQFNGNLLAVEEPGEPILWLDPANRMLPVGEVAPEYQMTTALLVESTTWKASSREIKTEPASASVRKFTFQVDATGAQAQVQMDASFTGSPAFQDRTTLGPKAPAEREAWYKASLEQAGLTVTKVEVLNAVDLSKPMGIKSAGTVALTPGQTLTLNPFPGLYSSLYLPETLPDMRQEPVLLPYLGVQEATSTVKVPKGYRLKKPIATTEETSWGTVYLEVKQDPDSGDLKARMEVATLMNYGYSYPTFKDFMALVRTAFHPQVTLDKTL